MYNAISITFILRYNECAKYIIIKNKTEYFSISSVRISWIVATKTTQSSETINSTTQLLKCVSKMIGLFWHLKCCSTTISNVVIIPIPNRIETAKSNTQPHGLVGFFCRGAPHANIYFTNLFAKLTVGINVCWTIIKFTSFVL